MKKTFDFDFGNGEFVMKDGNPVILSGINALKLWIQNVCGHSFTYTPYTKTNNTVQILKIW